MKPIEQLNNEESIYIELFGKRKKVEVFSTTISLTKQNIINPEISHCRKKKLPALTGL